MKINSFLFVLTLMIAQTSFGMADEARSKSDGSGAAGAAGVPEAQFDNEVSDEKPFFKVGHLGGRQSAIAVVRILKKAPIIVWPGARS